MMKSKKETFKFVDVVHFKENFDLLKYRLEVLNPWVDLFVILNFSDDETSSKFNKLNFWKNKTKIITISQTQNTFPFDKVTEEIQKLDLNFEDVVCFSNLGEIPDFSKFHEFIEKMSYEPLILRHLEYVLNPRIISEEKIFGTICFKFFQILLDQSLLSKMESIKGVLLNPYNYISDNGIKLTLFQNEIENFEKIKTSINYQLHPYRTNQSSPIKLKNCQFVFPFPTSNLPFIDFMMTPTKKVLVILNHFQKLVPNIDSQDYSEVLNFNFGQDYSLSEVTNTNNVINLNIFFPKNDLYNVPENGDFFKHYLLKEIQKVLKKKLYLSSQKIEIIEYFENWEEKLIITTNFEYIENYQNFKNLLN